MKHILQLTICLFIIAACKQQGADILKPTFTTDTTRHDTDDPAIWINANDPAQSLILGTDKNKDGALYVFDLNGKIIKDKVVRGLQRPNNVDVEYGLSLQSGDSTRITDIAVVTERLAHQLRIYSLPDMQPIDNGGISVFEGEQEAEYRDLMGIALYKRPTDGAIFAIVGRKNGPMSGYLWQYGLQDDGKGQVKASLVRKFGQFSGKNEIEAIVVDDALGYVYYSDEGVGVRKYHADPNKGNEEIALFATQDFAEDHEGIAIYAETDTTGYILISDQQANQFHVYPRTGNEHPLIAQLDFSTNESDGCEATAVPLNAAFPKGVFVAMSDDKTFQIYDWRAVVEQFD